MTIISIFGPMMIYFQVDLAGTVQFTVYALSWHLLFLSEWIPLIGMFTLFAGLPFSVLRFGYIWKLYHFYQTRDGKKEAILLGLLAELQVVIVLVFVVIIGQMIDPYPHPVSSVSYMFPIPILFLTGVVFVIAAPPKSDPTPSKAEWVES